MSPTQPRGCLGTRWQSQPQLETIARIWCTGLARGPVFPTISESKLIDLRTSQSPQPTGFSPNVLRHKWEAYCNTNGRRTAIQMGGVLIVFPFLRAQGTQFVLQYKLEAYCSTNWRCIAILFREVVVVGVSDILLIIDLRESAFQASDCKHRLLTRNRFSELQTHPNLHNSV